MVVNLKILFIFSQVLIYFLTYRGIDPMEIGIVAMELNFCFMFVGLMILEAQQEKTKNWIKYWGSIILMHPILIGIAYL